MLAQNFKTATDLSLTAEELAAHIKVLGMLERGELKHVDDIDNIDKNIPNGFNMGYTGNDDSCGTVGCISGWVRVVMRRPMLECALALSASCQTSELYDLYFPELWDMDKITTEQAACALRNYLTFGEPRWSEILGESR